MMNKELNSDIETLFIPTDPKYFVLRSSSIKEMAKLRGNISGMVPSQVEEALFKKISGS
jgi:pantetheine-phosphate adenylyltransferase